MQLRAGFNSVVKEKKMLFSSDNYKHMYTINADEELLGLRSASLIKRG